MSEIDDLRARNAELERNYARLLDDMEVLRRRCRGAMEGGDDAFIEQRERERLRADTANAAIKKHMALGKGMELHALDMIGKHGAGLAEASQADEVPFLLALVLQAGRSLEKQHDQSFERAILPRLRQQDGAEDPDTVLSIAAHHLKRAGAYQFGAMVIAATRLTTNDPRRICAEIMVTLQTTDTVSVNLVKRLPRAWIEAHLDSQPSYDQLRNELIKTYTDEATGSESLRRRHKRWLKIIEDTAQAILKLTDTGV